MNKLIYYFTSAFSIISLSLISQNRSISFEHGTFRELKEKALKENKLIFVDAYTTWCGPCKAMSANVFTNDTVADYYNKNFVNAKIDMEKGEGITIAKDYEVACYPTLLYIDGKGNIVHRISGYMNSHDFINVGEQTKKPEMCFSYYKNNYATNKNDAEFLKKYINAYSSTCLNPNEAVANYFSFQKDENLITKENWEMILNYTNEMESREFKYLLTNKVKFEDLYSVEMVNEKIDGVHFSSLMHVMSASPFDETKYTQLKTKINASNSGNTKKVLFEADTRLAKKNNDLTTYTKLSIAYIDTYCLKDANMLNNTAWDFYENISDKSALLKAESWAKTATELAPNYANLDTYAALLYKNGNKKLALEIATKAIEGAKKENYKPEDYKSTSDLLNNIKAMK